MSSVYDSMNDENSKLKEACECLDDCNEILYKFDIRYDNFTKNYHENSSLSIASAQVRFSDDQYIAYKRYATHGTVELLSVVGGLLGLFLGVSVLSIVEVFYFFIFRFLTDLWWNKARD
jgi:acid-sensing ion channel, other